MFRKIFMFALLLCTSVTLPAQAEDQSSAFDRLLEKIKDHPQIAAYASKADSLHDYAQGELGLPDPMLSFQVQDIPLGASRSADAEERMIGFKQDIPHRDIRVARSGKTKAEAQKTRLMAGYAFAAMKARLITALANRQSLKEQDTLLDAQENLFRSERRSLKGRIAANQSSASRFSMSEADSVEVAIVRAELKEQAHENEAMLVNMTGEMPDIMPPPVTMTAWSNDPAKTWPVRIAGEDISMAQKEAEVRAAEFGPNFAVEANYGRMNNGDTAGTFMVGVSVPLWAAQSQKPRLAGARAALRASRLDQDTIKREVVETLDHLKTQIEISDRKIGLLEKKRAHLAAGAKTLTREYEAGKADMTMYLKTQRDAISARMALAQERAKNIALIADFNRYIVEEETP